MFSYQLMREDDADQRLSGQVEWQGRRRFHLQRNKMTGHLDLMIFKIHCLIYPAETDNQLLFTLQLLYKLYIMSKETYANDSYLQRKK